jgi:hypothetical protein
MSLSAELEELGNWVERLPSVGMHTLGGAGAPMYVLDFIMIGAVKRSLSLGSGLIGMVKSKNMVCSRALLRMQLDTVTRLLAYTYVDDSEAMAKEVLGGKKLASFKSRDGKQLRDWYLVDRMTEDHPWVRKVYDFTSGYVHFSESQFFDSVKSTGSDGERTIQIQVSHIDDKYPEFSWLEVVECFNHLLKILEELLLSYAREREANK